MYQDESGQWWAPRHDGQRARCYPRVCHRCGADYVPYPLAKAQAEARQHCTRKCYAACRAEGNHDDVETRIRRGPKNHQWRGGRIQRRGYILVYAPDHHSIAGRGTKRKYVLEHRIVMEAKLGRPLKSNETVHHINGIKTDNRPENLELWGHQPSGQRVGEGKHCATCTCVDHT